MSPSINTNLLAGNAARNTAEHYSRLSASVRRLSTGLRVGTAADDAAGLAIRELMRTDIAGLQQGARNANDAISIVDVATEMTNMVRNQILSQSSISMLAQANTLPQMLTRLIGG